MKPDGRSQDRPAVAVITGIGDVLNVERAEDPAPQVGRIVSLEDPLVAVVDLSVSQDKSQAPESQILPVIARNSVDDESRADLVELSPPGDPAEIKAKS